MRAEDGREVVTFYYFAYGSNVLTTRLGQRCPGAILLGRAEADHTMIEFSKPSIENSGEATLRHVSVKRTCGVSLIPSSELSSHRRDPHLAGGR